MIITARLAADTAQFVRFTWSDDLSDLNFLAFGAVANSSLDALLAADVHEGAPLAGWVVTLD